MWGEKMLQLKVIGLKKVYKFAIKHFLTGLIVSFITVENTIKQSKIQPPFS